MAGWHHRLNGHELEQDLRVGDGQGGLVCCSPWGQEELDRTEWLNWTELKRLWGASRGGFSWRLSLWLVSSHLFCIHITSVFSSFKDTSPIEAHSFVVVQLLFMSTKHWLQLARLLCPLLSPGVCLKRPTHMPWFNFNYLFESSISKYSHIGSQSLNLWTLGTQFNP